MKTGTSSETDASGAALAIFALGHADASLSFIRLLPDETRADVETILAFRLLSRLWNQYCIDNGASPGRTLLGADNGYEIRVFSALIDEVCNWPPLRVANGVVRSHSPALSLYERELYETELDDKRPQLLDIGEQIERLPLDITPWKRAALLIDRCHKLDEMSDHGICWGLNLSGAFSLLPLGSPKAAIPFPALFSREMLRFDRSPSWRESALQAGIAESAHAVSAMAFGGFNDHIAFDREFQSLRKHSRLRRAFHYLAGSGELSPALLGRLLGCSAPGARKMLNQLVLAGLATHHPPSPIFSHLGRFRLGWSSALWLRSFSVEAAAPFMDLFDD